MKEYKSNKEARAKKISGGGSDGGKLSDSSSWNQPASPDEPVGETYADYKQAELVRPVGGKNARKRLDRYAAGGKVKPKATNVTVIVQQPKDKAPQPMPVPMPVPAKPPAPPAGPPPGAGPAAGPMPGGAGPMSSMPQMPMRKRGGKVCKRESGGPVSSLDSYVNPNAKAGRRMSEALETGTVPKRKSGGWIKGAIKHPGALHKELGVPEGKKIPAKKLNKAAHSDNPRLRARANLAKTLKGMHHKADGGAVTTGDKQDKGGFISWYGRKMTDADMKAKGTDVPMTYPAKDQSRLDGKWNGGPVMHDGAGSGPGRIEKTKKSKAKALPGSNPVARKRGGKVTMDAGAGSGKGRIEKIKDYGAKPLPGKDPL